jgi:exodeoxyribonuclease III
MKFLNERASIVAGDFNNSVVWDKPGGTGNFRAVATDLETNGFKSSYHSINKCSYGSEPDKTLFFRKNTEMTYHIDYCFASATLDAKIKKVEVGSHSKWLRYSDHVPLIIDFNC